MPIPIDERGRAADVQVHVSSGAGVDIRWADGHASHYEFPFLREHCPCATCNDERGKKIQVPTVVNSPLPMFKPMAKARSAKAVGNYALQIEFSDGHATGIYSFSYLREICPCEGCTAGRAE